MDSFCIDSFLNELFGLLLKEVVLCLLDMNLLLDQQIVVWW